MLRNDEEMLCTKIGKEIMSKVREHKNKTHIPMRWQIEMALTNYFLKEAGDERQTSEH